VVTSETQTITEFLLARYAEDVSVARQWIAGRKPWDGDTFDAGSPERVLAECEAKRRIVAEYAKEVEYDKKYPYHGDSGDCTQPGLESALCTLASVYADHPDWREEWKA
jgi:hypothetical protein